MLHESGKTTKKVRHAKADDYRRQNGEVLK
jgi:hypothetical protein